MIILDPLPGRKMVVNQPGPYARYFVGTDRRPDAATANGYPAVELAFSNCSR
jgi:hypothetical protein